ncbi:MAG: right-handed parallel beta-helix repeat-containing protein, partial [Anaerolineaceae bacterium]|nr:right-handed parallel beta-helix repeat-containing protein [Anaerolineaceae bacterium]
MKSLRILAVITLLLIVFSILPFPPAHAQTAGSTIAVTSAENAGPGTLRQALETAQPGDTITFDPAVFPLDNPRVISLTQELPPIQRGSITIDASGAGVILDGARINVEISTDLDDIQFSINGEVLISSDFTRGTDDWQPEDPSRADQWLVWNPEEGADTPGSLNIGNRPTGNRLITYHDPVAGKMWFEFYAADSSTWFHINPGDQLELRYTYKGAAHSAAFAYRDTERDDTFSFGDQWMPESKTWQPVALNAVVPEGAALIFPMFQPENPYHGAGLFLASDNNIIRGLTIRNFNAAIVLQGNDNLIGSDTSVTASTCAEGCNLLSGYFSGIQIEGDRNRVSGNQISARARDEHHTVWVNAVYLSGASTGTIIEKNVITFEHSDDLERIETGVFIGNEAVDARIGPNNLIQGPTQFGVAINSSSALVENNEIIDTGNCGIFLHQTRAVVITANWIGERKDGSPAESQFGVCLNGAEETQIGPDNVIAHNEFHAIDLGNAPRATITRNILRDNQRGSIVNWSPAGDEPAPPEIITVSTTTLTVVGNAEAGAMIEIYFGEGEEYAVSCEANQRGRFHCTIPREQFRADASITATASRDGGSTSTFAESYLIHAPVVTSLTGITSPLNLPNDPQVIGISLGIAVLLFVCFNLLANMSTDWINDILEGDSSLLKKAVNWIEKVMIIETGKNRLRFYLLWG